MPCWVSASHSKAIWPGELQIHRMLVLVRVLEERQSTAIAQREEGVAILAAGGRRPLRPGGYQGQAQDVLVKVG